MQEHVPNGADHKVSCVAYIEGEAGDELQSQKWIQEVVDEDALRYVASKDDVRTFNWSLGNLW